MGGILERIPACFPKFEPLLHSVVVAAKFAQLKRDKSTKRGGSGDLYHDEGPRKWVPETLATISGFSFKDPFRYAFSFAMLGIWCDKVCCSCTTTEAYRWLREVTFFFDSEILVQKCQGESWGAFKWRREQNALFFVFFSHYT